MRSRPQVTALLVLAAGCVSSPRIHDRPIAFSTARHTATLHYIAQHYAKFPRNISITPRIIVLHWTAIDDLEEAFAEFDSEQVLGSRPDLAVAGRVNVSAQFLVDRDGSIYRLMPATWMARHVIGLNYSAIGVENVGGGDGVDNLTDAQIAANIQLVRHLVRRYPSIRYLIGHMESPEFEGHPLWLERDESYRAEKVDPGVRFMDAVRRAVADLDLKGPQRIRAEKQALSPSRTP